MHGFVLELLRFSITSCSRIRLVRRQCGWWWRWRRGGRDVRTFPELLATTKWVSVIACIPTLSTCQKLLVHFCGLFLSRLEDDGSSRRTRLLRLCSYLQHKYKHMCRQERASIRQKKYRYAFRKALLHAASNNPDSAGQLIQELRGASRRWSRYFHKCPIIKFLKLVIQFTWLGYFHSLSTAASRLISFEIWLLLIYWFSFYLINLKHVKHKC